MFLEAAIIASLNVSDCLELVEAEMLRTEVTVVRNHLRREAEDLPSI